MSTETTPSPPPPQVSSPKRQTVSIVLLVLLILLAALTGYLAYQLQQTNNQLQQTNNQLSHLQDNWTKSVYGSGSCTGTVSSDGLTYTNICNMPTGGTCTSVLVYASDFRTFSETVTCHQ